MNLYQADVALICPGLESTPIDIADRPLFMSGNVAFNPAGP
jgi:hypothetical protein